MSAEGTSAGPAAGPEAVPVVPAAGPAAQHALHSTNHEVEVCGPQINITYNYINTTHKQNNN